MSEKPSIGARIIEAITHGGLIEVKGQTEPVTFIWSASTVEQLDAVVAGSFPDPPAVPITRMWDQGDRVESIKSRFGKGEWRVSDLQKAVENVPAFELPLYHIDLGSYDFDTGDDGGLVGFARHMRHVLDADLSHPVIMDEWGRIIDGRHRIVKALIEGLPTVLCKRLPPGTVPTHA